MRFLKPKMTDCPEAVVMQSVLITVINDYALACRKKDNKEIESLQSWAADIHNLTFKMCASSIDLDPEVLRDHLNNTFRKIENGELYAIKKTRNYYIKDEA